MTAPFTNILVPLDFTDKNARAVELAQALAAQGRALVTLLHVIETIGDMADEETTEFYDQLEQSASAKLQATAEPLAAAGLDVQQEIVFGRRGPEIVRYQVERDVDLVVLSSHKVDLSGPTGELATLSHQVSILCQCPVLLAR